MSLKKGDLKRLLHTEIHIDEFDSKLGENKDVVVVSLKVYSKEPAQDICGFVEKGYEWVLDADISAGEMDDGDYLVFVELPRDSEAPAHILEMMEDIMNLTEQEITGYRVRYHTGHEEHSLDLETLERLIPTSPGEYQAKYEQDKDQEQDHSDDIDSLKAAAGVNIDKKAPKNEYTESLRIAAGIR